MILRRDKQIFSDRLNTENTATLAVRHEASLRLMFQVSKWFLLQLRKVFVSWVKYLKQLVIGSKYSEPFDDQRPAKSLKTDTPNHTPFQISLSFFHLIESVIFQPEAYQSITPQQFSSYFLATLTWVTTISIKNKLISDLLLESSSL